MPTALIVEDEPEANKLLSMLVRLRGYRTDSALNGKDALALVDQSPPDIIFLDLMLPDINGYEVCASLKSRKQTAMIPVVMVTARVTLENRVRSFVLGADQYVPKPYTPDQIYDAIDDAKDWLDNVERGPSSVGILLESRDDGESLRQLSRLRSLLLATTALDTESVDAIAQALRQIAVEADLWGQKTGVSQVARLDFQRLPDRLEFSLTDLAGWIEPRQKPVEDHWNEIAKNARFEPPEIAADLNSVKFIRHLNA